MRLVIRNYFHLANSFIGDLYFEVSKQLGMRPSEVIKQKFTPDIKFMLMKNAQILRNRKKAYDDIKDNQ